MFHFEVRKLDSETSVTGAKIWCFDGKPVGLLL